jgi:predicted DNA-binding protein
MTEEHVKKLEELQEFALCKAMYIKSEVEKHMDDMSTSMFSQALDDIKDCTKIVRDTEISIAMVHNPQQFDPTKLAK